MAQLFKPALSVPSEPYCSDGLIITIMSYCVAFYSFYCALLLLEIAVVEGQQYGTEKEEERMPGWRKAIDGCRKLGKQAV